MMLQINSQNNINRQFRESKQYELNDDYNVYNIYNTQDKNLLNKILSRTIQNFFSRLMILITPSISLFSIFLFTIYLNTNQIICGNCQSLCSSYNSLQLNVSGSNTITSGVQDCTGCQVGCHLQVDNTIVWTDSNSGAQVSVRGCFLDCTANATGYCTSCNSDRINCDSCKSPYIFQNGNCLLCGNAFKYCASCDPIKCVGCVNQYILQGASCIQCSTIPNCAKCDSTQCVTCDLGFYISSPVCISCDAPCVTCQGSSTYCTSCSAGSILLSQDSTCQVCTTFIPHCAACDPVNCITCQTNYVIHTQTSPDSCSMCSIYGCSICATSTSCSKCFDGFYLNSFNQCMPCDYPCTTCKTNANDCTSCNTTSLEYYPTSITAPLFCYLCNNLDANCKLCQLSGCLQCISTLYYINGGICLGCPIQCGTCQSNGTCITCKKFTTYYNNGSSVCLACSTSIPNCLSCISQSVCFKCDQTTGVFLYIIDPPNRCVLCSQVTLNCLTCDGTRIPSVCLTCIPKFFINGTQCDKCPYLCATCTGLNLCLTCISPPQLQVDLITNLCKFCDQLIPNCIQCSTATTCTKCVNSTYPFGGNCMPCGANRYALDAVLFVDCLTCSLPCLNCADSNVCTQCLPYYTFYPNAKFCYDTCGDNIVTTDQCDNGYGVLNDGCSDQCREQTNYTCTIFPANISTSPQAKVSSCSYNQPIQISIFSIKKQKFLNNITLTYSLFPYLYGLPSTTARQFTQPQLIQTFLLIETFNPNARLLTTTSTLVVDSISVDVGKSQVSLTVEYSNIIKYSDLKMTVDFAYLRTLGIINFQHTPVVSHNTRIADYQANTMAGVAFTDQQYSQASLIYQLCFVICILSLAAFALSLFTKSLSGLQLIMLLQFIYLSLLTYPSTLPLSLLTLSPLKYSTGLSISFQNQQLIGVIDDGIGQSGTMEFYGNVLGYNFNVMAGLYAVPLGLLAVMVLFKAKVVRRISVVQFGHKWADIFVGEWNIYFALFNFQYFLFCLIQYYRNPSIYQDYVSIIVTIIGSMATLISLYIYVFKPEIVGNFRSAFLFNANLSQQKVQIQVPSIAKLNEQRMLKKFQEGSRLGFCKQLQKKWCILINQNYLHRNHRKVHSLLSFNHYILLITFYFISTMVTSLISSSQISILIISLVITIELIVIRPYGQVGEKIRAIWFFIIKVYVSFVKVIFNANVNVVLGYVVVLVAGLIIAVLFTYFILVNQFYTFYKTVTDTRKQTVDKIFQDKDILEHTHNQQKSHDQQALLRKLMKRYQRVQLQYDFNNARNKLLNSYSSQNKYNPLKKPQQPLPKMAPQKIISQLQQQNNFKDLKILLQKQKLIHKKQQASLKVDEKKMTRLLNLDNFKKYQQQFLYTKEEKINAMTELEKIELRKDQIQYQELMKEHQDKNDTDIKQHQNQQIKHMNNKDEYVSVQPKTLEQAEEKFNQQNILIEENQHIRYQKAMRIITKDGLKVDFNLIKNNFDKI